MKIAIFCILAAANLILAEGKALGFPYKGGVEIEDLGHHPLPPKYDITEKELSFNALRDKLDTLKKYSKRFGFDLDNLKERAGDKIDKFKEYAKKKGVDIDALKEKVIGEIDQFKRKVKGYDLDEIKQRVGGHVQKVKDMTKDVDMGWARRIYNQVKERGSKVLGRKDEGTISKLKRKTKEAFKNLLSKVFD